MIKSLSNISDISVIDQNGSNDILSFSKVEFDDNVLGSGGFGSVHNVHSIDGIERSVFVLKIFTDEVNKQHAYDVIKLLHEKIKKRQSKTGMPIYHDLPELLGLPFLVFKGYDNISEKHCVAFLMYNLEKLNYEDYGSDTANLEDYKKLSIPDKLYLAYKLTKTVDFLHKIEFIHADLSENSLWFNSSRIRLAIIDYDSGYHFDKQSKPTTIGKIGHWISGGFRNLIGQKKDSSKLTTLDRLYEEYWVLANAIFEVVFGVMPFFFLSDTEDNTKKSYLKEFEWPNIDYSSPLFNKSNIQQHKTIVSFLNQLENAGAKGLITAFKYVFNKGYQNETKRLTSREWRKLLYHLNNSLENYPLIENFTSNKNSINRINEEVKFSFFIKKSNRVYLNDVLIPINQDSHIIPLQDTSKIILKAENDFNKIEDFIEIKALKKQPEILTFKSSKSLRNSLEPIILKWNTKNVLTIEINNIDKSFPLEGEITVEPNNKTVYVLTAKGFFNEIISKELEVDVVVPIIKSFTWEINLNEGIDNIDLHWETEETESVEIIPNVKDNAPSGLAHVPINKETTFKLIAKGLFSNVEKEITAHPFPVPIVKQIFTETPKIEIKTKLDFTKSNLPKELFTANNIQFSNSVYFNNLDIDSTELKNNLEFPKFESENALISKYSKQKITLSDIYDSVIEKVYKKINK